MLCIRGTEEYFGLEGKADVINSTLGKALGGAAGLHFLLS
jgi:glycine C-acetyltransferase